MREKRTVEIRLITLFCIFLIVIGALYFSIDNIQKNVGGIGNSEKEYSILAADDLKVQEMYRIVSLSKPALESPFYNTTTTLTRNSFSDSQKLLLAYYLEINQDTDVKQEAEQSVILEQVMDEAVKKVFGRDVSYQKTNFNPVFDNSYVYLVDKNSYIKQNGYAYSGDTNLLNYHRINKVYEYDSYYEIYDQIIFIEKKFKEKTSEIEGYTIYSDYQKKNCIATLTSEEYMKIIGDINNGQALIEKYKNLLLTYRHTFIKNEDDTCYWYQSEVVK